MDSPVNQFESLPNELLAQILTFVTDPMHWQNCSLVCKLWNQTAEQAFTSQIQDVTISLPYSAEVTRSPEFTEREGNFFLDETFVLIIKGPSMKPRGLHLEYDPESWTLLLEILIPRLWRHARNLSWSCHTIKIDQESRSYQRRVFIPPGFGRPISRILETLLELQSNRPRTIIGFHIITFLQMAASLPLRCLQQWKSTLREITLCFPSIDLIQWIPCLFHSPLTHLTIALGQRSNENDAVWHDNRFAPLRDIAALEKLVTKPFSKIQSLNLKFLDYYELDQFNITSIAQLIGRIPPNRQVSFMLPSIGADHLLFGKQGWFGEVIQSLADNQPFTPLQLTLEELTLGPADQCPAIETPILEAFPRLTRINAAHCGAPLVESCVAIACHREKNGLPLHLNVHCNSMAYHHIDYQEALGRAAAEIWNLLLRNHALFVLIQTGNPVKEETTIISVGTFDNQIQICIHIPIRVKPISYFESGQLD
jgi:hypothetical protein